MDTLSAGGLACVTLSAIDMDPAGLACVTVPLLVLREINKVGGAKVTIMIEVTTVDKMTLSHQVQKNTPWLEAKIIQIWFLSTESYDEW